ncbi:MAG TPA: VirB8/TrbF family protein [Rhodothermales bacterium]
MSTYPSPDHIGIPEPDEPSEDQEYYVGWLVQHHRAWLTIWGLAALAVLEALVLILVVARFKPTVQYVTLDGGYVTVWNERGNPVIDNKEYVPARLRAVVQSFVMNRYEYDWQNLQKLNTALKLMSVEAAEAERQKINDLNLAASIVTPRLKSTLTLDYTNWKVVAQGAGQFAVELQGQLSLNDALRYPDPQHPFVKPVTIKLVVKTVPATDVNPLGYVIVSTGRDLL